MQIRTWVSDLGQILDRYEKILYLALTALLLWPIWANQYFLTLDGPCHLYNSAVLLDFWRGIDVPFFSKFYKLNPFIDPNWFSHISLACLMRFVSPQLSEKLFLSSYVLCFLLASRWLIMYINQANKLLTFLPFLFVYHHVFQMGFYNFSYSLALMIATWLFFLKYIDRMSIYLLLPVGAMIFMLTYLAHPVGFLLACFTLSLFLFFKSIEGQRSMVQVLKTFLPRFAIIFVAMLPSLLLLGYFLVRRSSYAVEAAHDTLKTLCHQISSLTAIVTLSSAEDAYARIAFVVIAAVMSIAFFRRLFSGHFSRYDSFLVATICIIIFYLKAPSGIAGAGMVNERIQIIPFVILPFWLASVALPRWLLTMTGLSSIILISGLMSVRIPIHKQCSDTISEYMTLSKYIDPYSTVLPLSYAHNGKTPDGKMISDRTWIFFHAADYLGTQKPLIMMGNYEGTLGYFPLLWKWDKNPFVHACVDDGIESVPPNVDIPKYERETSTTIDYIILLCMDSEVAKHPYTINLMKELNNSYTKAHVSEFGRAILYQRKKGQ